MSNLDRAIRIAIVGPGRSGKDEAAEYLKRFGFRYEKSTSAVIWPHAAKLLGQSLAEAWETRHKYRNTWYAIGCNLRDRDPAALVREVLKTGNIVVGVRDGIEMKTAIDEGLIDLTIWIDRDVPEDPTLTFGKELADIVIPNNEGLPEFHARLDRLAKTLRCSADTPPTKGRVDYSSVIDNGFPAFGQWQIGGHKVNAAGTDGANAMPIGKPLEIPIEALGVKIGTYTIRATVPAKTKGDQPPKPPQNPPLPSLGGVPRDQITIYLSGPMTGYDDFNYPAFDGAAAALRHRGWRVVSPADFAAKSDIPWQECLQRDLAILGYCDVIVTLVGWEASRGATLETDVARQLGKEIMTLAEILDLG